jgi:hypothetical protein
VRTALTVPRTTKAVPKRINAKKINRTHILGYLKHFITLNYACQRNSGLPRLETIGFSLPLGGTPRSLSTISDAFNPAWRKNVANAGVNAYNRAAETSP